MIDFTDANVREAYRNGMASVRHGCHILDMFPRNPYSIDTVCDTNMFNAFELGFNDSFQELIQYYNFIREDFDQLRDQ